MIDWLPDWSAIYLMNIDSRASLQADTLFALENNCTPKYASGPPNDCIISYTCTEEDLILIKLKYPNIVKHVFTK